MKGTHEHLKNFKENIRAINNSLAFASFGANIAPPPGYGPYCFRIHGSIYHRTRSLHSVNGETRKYAQLYILDPEQAVSERMQTNAYFGISEDLMNILSQLMANINPSAKAYKIMYEVEKESMRDQDLQELPKVTMATIQDRKDDCRRYSAPNQNEVAIIFQNADGEPPLNRDILIHCRPNAADQNPRKTERISVLDPKLEPMVYPLFFPCGEQSLGVDIPLQNRPTSLPWRVSQNPRVRVT